MKFVAALLILSLVGYGSSQFCTSSSDCGDNQCCVDQSPLIYSRKRQLQGILPVDDFAHFGGVCRNIGGRGDSCESFYTCGRCQAGLTCVYDHSVYPWLTSILGKRDMITIPATCQTDDGSA